MLLIVDDSALFRMMVRKAVETKFDINIEEQGTVRGMQSFLASFPLKDISLIILDLNLPDGNGLAALARVIDGKGGIKLPFIIVSKDVNRAIIPLAQKYGVRDILAKPINPEELTEKIVKLFPQAFVPRGKAKKQVEDYSENIRLELKRAQMGKYSFTLFLLEVGSPDHGEFQAQSGADRLLVNLKMRLSLGELDLILPLSETTCLIVMPFNGSGEKAALKVYFREELLKAKLISREKDLVVASAVYPDDGEYVSDLLDYLKEDLAQQRSANSS